MNNADMPAMPQERDWQNDMEAHVANSTSGEPPSTGSGLTKREHFTALAMQGLLASGAYSEMVGYQLSTNVSHEAASVADATLKRLERD